MQLAFDRFYRDRGIRTYSQLAAPRLWAVRELPKDSVVHFLGGETEMFPDPSGIYVQFAKRKILLRNVLDLLAENNSQGKKLFNYKNEITKFVAKNNFFINFIKPLSDAKEPTQLVFVNYNLIKFAYRYNDNHPLTPHKKWLDANSTVWSEINECCKHAQKEHFIDVRLPELLPAKSKLDMYSTALNAQIEDFFGTPEAKFILDFWKWLNPETRPTSCMGNVEVNNLKHVNLLFHVKDGRSAILNLGYMNSWIEGQLNQTDRPKVSQMPANQLRMYFLKFLIVLQNLSVELLQSERESALDKEDDSQRPSDELGDDEQRNLTDGTGSEDGQGNVEEETVESSSNLDLGSDAFNLTSKVVSKGTNSVKASPKVSGAKEVANEGEPETPRDNLDDIEKDIQALEDLNDRRERLSSLEAKVEGEVDLEIDQNPEEILAEINQPKRPEERLLQSLDVEVVKKNISAADYRKVVKTLEDQKTAPDPFGSGKTLTEMTTITKEDLAFDIEKTKLVGDERAVDPSMLESVVESLDRDYIKKTMNKDVISTIMAIQSSKILVTDIETEEHNSALGAFITHALTLKPLNGRTSVIRIKYPKVSEDGTFVSNGVRYHLRRQRADLPIRLITPGKVSLSSYYGTKLFVYRSPKIADTMLAPVQKLLTLASNGESEIIYNVRPANVLDRSLKAPFIYNAFGENYKSFSVKHPIFGDLLLDFEYKKRGELVSDPGVLTTLEKDGAIVVGKTKKGRPIYVAKDNHFYAKLENGIQPLGDIFDIVGLDRLDAPVDFAITKVMGNAIPVGFILGRFLGLKKLLKMSGARHRLVKARKQKNLQPYEYAVNFEDVSLILDRRDEKATLLFGGFEKYKYIKAFPIAAYEEKEVFEDIFDSMGMNMGVIREIELLESSFVDPITKTVLEEMKEPVTFLGLLDRACEMLLKYEAPESQDFAFQQIKSYERFPGAIYKQLMKSIRTFRNKNISGRSKVEMSPFAVSQAIQEDRGVKTCEDINPIKNLAMHESVTFAGDGGRDKDTFTAEARAFGLNDAGVFSEASVDSSMVGYNVFMSSNPQIKNLRGLRKEGALPGQAGSYLSPSMLVAVGAQHDDQLVCLCRNA